jgi:putative hemolysin
LESDSWLSIAIFIILLFVSAFFSGSETAFFSLKHSERRKLKEAGKTSRAARKVLDLLNQPRRLLVSILIGNTIVNVSAATVAALFTHRIMQTTALADWSFLFDVVIVTAVILLFSEISPKIVAVKRPLLFAINASQVLWIFTIIFLPISFLFEQLTHGLAKVTGSHKEVPFVNEDELKTLIEVGEEKGTLDKSEREMIHSIFEFRETMAREIMVPRMDMVAVEKESPLHEVLTLVETEGHSRIPIYKETIDNIIGILYVKDLLAYSKGQNKTKSLSELSRKPYFVPESKLIDELLREFQKERIHMAIVVDEYGGTAGLVTLEDVIEEIVGDIRDEYDQEKPLVKSVGKREWLVDGKIDIEELNEQLNLNLPSEEDFESLGGFIFSQLGAIPREKEVVQFDDFQFLVEKVVGRRIKSVRIFKKEPKENTEPTTT